MTDKRNFKVFRDSEIKIVGKIQAEVLPHTDIKVLPSPLGSIFISGYKCQHGVYIPATSVSSDHALYCSLCNPYLVEKTDAK